MDGDPFFPVCIDREGLGRFRAESIPAQVAYIDEGQVLAFIGLMSLRARPPSGPAAPRAAHHEDPFFPACVEREGLGRFRAESIPAQVTYIDEDPVLAFIGLMGLRARPPSGSAAQRAAHHKVTKKLRKPPRD